MVSSVESCYKTVLVHILDLVLQLLTNAPPLSTNVSQGGDKGDITLKHNGEDKGKVVRKVFSIQSLTSVHMKVVMESLTTTTIVAPNIEFNMSKLQLKKLTENYKDPDEFKKLNIRFYVVLRKNEKDMWSLVNIKLISITHDTLIEGVLKNYRYSLVRENNVLFDFTITDFPLMNLVDLVMIAKILGDLIKSQIHEKSSYIIGYGHIKCFLDCYYAYLALTYLDLSTAINKNLKVSKALLKV
ncbi:unnamed protein product [Lactuca saligna]|uniref:Uncharacterized protein n=1 Tax=Lactuca saligna TaxID=75948 RepID=A0AA36E3C3_LACSI|nr:unnamed protein product [Lactuca saligna]